MSCLSQPRPPFPSPLPSFPFPFEVNQKTLTAAPLLKKKIRETPGQIYRTASSSPDQRTGCAGPSLSLPLRC